MPTRFGPGLRGLLGHAALLASVACIGSTPPSRHYVLTPIAASPTGTASAPAPDLALAVGPVTLPAYLDRPQLVVESGTNERDLDELSRWAEPLDVGLARVLRENLSRLLGTEHVSAWPGQQAEPPRYRVAVEVVRFEPSLRDGIANLQARWTVFAGDTPVVLRRSHISQPVRGSGQAAWVEALSGATAELSRELALQIHALAGRTR